MSRRAQESLDETLAAFGVAHAGGRLASPQLRGRLVASVKRAGRYGVFADRVARLFDLPVDDAAKLVARLDDPGVWAPWLDGAEMFPVRPGPRLEGAVCGFGRLAAGSRFPHHEHVGDEVTLVLDGGFLDEDSGVEIWRGEELFKAAGTPHDFVVLEGQQCIAAVAAMGGVRFV
jgi:hypothetical protein